MLIGLLLPAVQAARESARRMECVNNMKQMMLATLNYEEARDILPPGSVFRDHVPPYVHKRPGILVRILPYAENPVLHDLIDPEGDEETDLKQLPDGTYLAEYVVDMYVCPSDTGELVRLGRSSNTPRARTNYAASYGSMKKTGTAPYCACPPAVMNEFNAFGLGTFNAADLSEYSGPFTRQQHPTKLTQITDGLSNTIFFGEARPDCSDHIQEGWAGHNNGSGLVSTVIPINYDTCNHDDDPVPAQHKKCNWATELGFRSAHPGGANFALGDGSVHFFTENLDHQTYQYLGDKADGQVISGDVF